MTRRKIEGRRIVRIDLDPQLVEGEELTSPRIWLDDGSYLRFYAQESPDGGEPGVGLVHETQMLMCDKKKTK